MNVTVTGGAGFIGSVLTPLLLERGHAVTVIDNLMYGGASLLPLFIHPRFSFVQADILDRSSLKRAVESADAVIHLAALVGYPLCKMHPKRATEVNVDGTRLLTEVLPSSARLLYAATCSGYGKVEGACTEDTPQRPGSLYAETKLEAESMCLGRGNARSLRLATAFGLSPRMRLDLLMNDFTWQAVHRGQLVVYERAYRRTFIHVRDIARAFVHALDRDDVLEHTVYNVGHDSLNLTKEDVVNRLAQRVDFKSTFAEFDKDEEQRDHEVDYSRIAETGFALEVSVDAGMDELVGGIAVLPSREGFGNV